MNGYESISVITMNYLALAKVNCSRTYYFYSHKKIYSEIQHVNFCSRPLKVYFGAVRLKSIAPFGEG